ncbi:hypothetical protein PBY51_004044 [Eleginops maclovinus]|uniref:Uncharacterized protein n=1 Tax=Eleginops maclovinus TaxID=56733 RepID=A0AAN8AWX2_ELEMC|nr:hypothetical protein PBY51_004044 [Eleginops maclovinus]
MSDLACLLGWPVGRPTKGRGGLIRGEEGLHRNSLEAGGTFYSTVKYTSEETNALRMKADSDVIAALAL